MRFSSLCGMKGVVRNERREENAEEVFAWRRRAAREVAAGQHGRPAYSDPR
jgi:hypothetical protein